MIFTPAPTTETYDVARWVSETGRWEFGCRRVLFGVRICANPVADDVHAVDYCAGADLAYIKTITNLVCTILKGLPESVTADEVAALMPRWSVRPIQQRGGQGLWEVPEPTLTRLIQAWEAAHDGACPFSPEGWEPVEVENVRG